MRKVWLCIFYALCIFTIVFSLFWMALPSLPFPADSGEETPPSEPGLAAQGSAGQSGTDFYLWPMPSGSSRASTSPAKRPSGRCWKTWANKQKQCRPSPGRSALFLSFIRIRLRAVPAG